MSSRKKVRSKKKEKRKGHIVKGITVRHWWDAYDHDFVRDTRMTVKEFDREQLPDQFAIYNDFLKEG